MMGSPRKIMVLLVLLCVVTFTEALASDFRCGPKIVTVGTYRSEVLRRCGNPSNVESWPEVRTRRDFGPGLLEPEKPIYLRPQIVEELVTIEEWEYNFGPNQFIRYLRFENGRLTKITTGDYGY